ncbi:MAG: hypothetical protein KatS3mg002_0042 [Candidatus Woesearchaeota archaeon]|nr:MAG: hypothetical protein KatS3mg002_0042 [Candidatus Woesearchaeota archaeon]
MNVNLDPGFYANLFEICINAIDIPIMIIERSKYPDLRGLRSEIEIAGKKVFVYAPEGSDNLYGFGNDMQWLSSRGFKQSNVNIYKETRLTSNIILEAFIKKAQELGFRPIFSKDKGRCRLFNFNEFKATTDKKVKIFLGYDIRVIFLKDQVENRLVFALILDITYSLKDLDDNPLNFHDITKKFGSSTLKEIRQIQRDLIPTGINKEISRQRLIEDILPFIEKISEIELSHDLKAQIIPNPARIVLGEEDESVW